jgi:hypothetical protein
MDRLPVRASASYIMLVFHVNVLFSILVFFIGLFWCPLWLGSAGVFSGNWMKI